MCLKKNRKFSFFQDCRRYQNLQVLLIGKLILWLKVLKKRNIGLFRQGSNTPSTQIIIIIVCCCRRIVWVCLTIFWGWCSKFLGIFSSLDWLSNSSMSLWNNTSTVTCWKTLFLTWCRSELLIKVSNSDGKVKTLLLSVGPQFIGKSFRQIVILQQNSPPYKLQVKGQKISVRIIILPFNEVLEQSVRVFYFYAINLEWNCTTT